MSKKSRIIINIVIILAVVAAVLYVLYYILSNYRINPEKIVVDGNEHYTAAEIKDMVMEGPLGDNSLYLSIRYKNKKITDVPFVDAISVTVVSKDSVRITVFEKALAGYVKFLDHYVYFDKDGYVVESSTVLTEGIPQVTGISFSKIELGKKLGADSNNKEIFEKTLDITKLMSKYDLTVDRINFHENGEVILYFGNVRVNLGTDSLHIEDKVMNLPTFMETLRGLNGVLDMREYDETNGIYVFSSDTD